MRLNAAACHHPLYSACVSAPHRCAGRHDPPKNGRTILADHVRENGNRYEYDIGDDSYAIQKSSVDHIDAGGMPAHSDSALKAAGLPLSLRPIVLPTKAISSLESSKTGRSTPTFSLAWKAKAMPS